MTRIVERSQPSLLEEAQVIDTVAVEVQINRHVRKS
jgi:hypothetical protein